MNVDNAIKTFAEFLNGCWHFSAAVPHMRDFIFSPRNENEWLQANWELLVETRLISKDEFLEVYGDGADINGSSSRITYPDALPTHKVVVLPKQTNRVLDLLNNVPATLEKCRFERFVGFRDGFYSGSGPFNYVLLFDEKTGSELVVDINDINFGIWRV